MNINIKQVAAVAGVVIVVAGAIAAIEELRFWAWRTDLQQVAGDSYEAQIQRWQNLLILAQSRRDQCVKTDTACVEERKQVLRIKTEIKELETKKAKYGG